jgi:hypothetical protein
MALARASYVERDSPKRTGLYNENGRRINYCPRLLYYADRMDAKHFRRADTRPSKGRGAHLNG